MSNPRTFYGCRLNRIVDADTFSIVFDVGFYATVTVTCRLNHLDAPERGTPEAVNSLAFVRQWFADNPTFDVSVEKVPEKYGRWLVEILSATGGSSLNVLMLTGGLAKPYSGGKRV